MSFVHYQVQDRVAVLTIDNPPVNALAQGVWEAIDENVARAVRDADADAIVLIGAGSTFVAGADINIFKTLKTREQSLARSAKTHALLKRLEDATQAARRGHPRQRLRRRPRARAGLPLPRRDEGRQGRPAGSPARHHPRRRRHAAAAAAVRRGARGRRCAPTANPWQPEGQSCRHPRRDRRRRPAGRRDRFAKAKAAAHDIRQDARHRHHRRGVGRRARGLQAASRGAGKDRQGHSGAVRAPSKPSKRA